MNTGSRDESVCAECGYLLSDTVVAGDSGVPKTNAIERLDRTEFESPRAGSMDRRIAHFSLQRKLGEGGFGAVWLAHDLALDRQVAVKLPKEFRDDSMLMHEARTAAKLHHPNIVTVHEVGIEGSQVYIASEYIDGDTLRHEMNRGRLPVERTVSILDTLARAAAHAHSHGVIHRDLKPTNVMLSADGEPFITDFGIAKQISAEESISSEGAVIGTFSYMSPEQAMGHTRDTDHRADVYALGVMMFEMLTEYRPFRGNVEAIIRQKIHDDPPSPRRLVVSIPADLATICLKCLERDRAKRYQSATDLAEELERYREGMPILARPVSRAEKAWRWCHRQPVLASLVVGIFLSLVIGLSASSYFWAAAATNASQTRSALYRAQMNLIGTRWNNGDFAGLRASLASEPMRSMAKETDDFAFQYYSSALASFRQIVNHSDAVVDVAVSHDGRFFASAGKDSVIRIWNSENGRLVRTLQVASGQIGSIEFSPTNHQLVSSHSDGRIRLWSPAQHSRVLFELDHGDGLSHVRFVSPGTQLVTAGRRGQVKLWNLAERTAYGIATEQTSGVTALQTSLDGSRLAIAYQGGELAIWNLQTRELDINLPRCPNVLTLAFVPHENAIIAGTYATNCRFFSLLTGEQIQRIPGDGAIGDVEYLHLTKQVAIASSGETLRVFDDQFNLSCILPTHSRTYGMMAQSVDGRTLVLGSGDGTVKLLDVERLRRPHIMWHDTNLRDVEVTGSENQVVTSAADGSVHLWDLETGKRRELRGQTGLPSLALSVLLGDDDVVAAGGRASVDLLPINTSEESGPSNSTPQRTLPPQISLPFSGIIGLDVSADGRYLAIGSRSGNLLINDLREPTESVWESAPPNVSVHDLCFAPHGALLAVAFSDQTILVVDAGNASFTESTIRLSSIPTTIAFFDEGRKLAVGTQTGEIQLLSLTTDEPPRTIKCHSSRINSIAVFPNGRQIASGGRDRNIYIWDIESGERVAQLQGHHRQIFSLAIAADGRTIFSVGLAGDLRVWKGLPRSDEP